MHCPDDKLESDLMTDVLAGVSSARTCRYANITRTRVGEIPRSNVEKPGNTEYWMKPSQVLLAVVPSDSGGGLSVTAEVHAGNKWHTAHRKTCCSRRVVTEYWPNLLDKSRFNSLRRVSCASAALTVRSNTPVNVIRPEERQYAATGRLSGSSPPLCRMDYTPW